MKNFIIGFLAAMIVLIGVVYVYGQERFGLSTISDLTGNQNTEVSEVLDENQNDAVPTGDGDPSRTGGRSSAYDFYYATETLTINEGTQTSDTTTFEVFGDTYEGGKTKLAEFTLPQTDAVKEFRLAPEADSALIVQQHTLRLMDLESGSTTAILEETTETSTTTDNGRTVECESRFTGAVISSDASNVIATRDAGFSRDCPDERRTVIFEENESGEYVQTEVVAEGLPENGGFEAWANGILYEDFSKILAQGASCSRGPCPPYAGVFDIENAGWISLSNGFDDDERFSSTGLSLPKTAHAETAIQIGRRAELERCEVPMEATALSGEVVRLYDVENDTGFELVSDNSNRGYEPTGFFENGRYALLRQMNHVVDDGCVINTEETGYVLVDTENQTFERLSESIANFSSNAGQGHVYTRREGADFVLMVNGEKREDLENTIYFLGYAN